MFRSETALCLSHYERSRCTALQILREMSCDNGAVETAEHSLCALKGKPRIRLHAASLKSSVRVIPSPHRYFLLLETELLRTETTCKALLTAKCLISYDLALDGRAVVAAADILCTSQNTLTTTHAIQKVSRRRTTPSTQKTAPKLKLCKTEPATYGTWRHKKL